MCKFMSKTMKHHWEVLKGILRHLKGTTDHGIMFNKKQCAPLIVGYVDFDYAGDLDYKRSITKYVFTLARGPIC